MEQAVSEAICFGWIDSKMYSLDQNSYILRFSPRKPDSLWSRNNRIKAERLIAEGKIVPAGLQTIQDAQASGSWQSAYTSLEKPTLPADLAAALETEPDACHRFEHWPNSDQLQVAVWVSQAKRPETRLQRINSVMQWARQGGIPPDRYRSKAKQHIEL